MAGINPRASYKEALQMAGINQTKGIGKQGSRYDFDAALGLNQGDTAKEYQDKQDAGAIAPNNRDRSLSDATINYEVVNTVNDKYNQSGNLADINKTSLGYRYAVN
jgi:hypothetical protein